MTIFHYFVHIWIAIPLCLSAGTAEKMPGSGTVLDNWDPTHSTKQVNCISSCRRPAGFLQPQGYLECSARAHQRQWRPLLDVCHTHRPPAAADCHCLTSQPQQTRTPDSQQNKLVLHKQQVCSCLYYASWQISTVVWFMQSRVKVRGKWCWSIIMLIYCSIH